MNAPIRHPHDQRRKGWMQTLHGGTFYPAKPLPDALDINDIAGALSKMCRYNGHCKHFYSVAEHCVHVSTQVADEYKLTALMHDASEAYLADVIRPVKPLLTNYYDLENRLMGTIASKFKFDWPLPIEVTRADVAILSDERYQNMAEIDSSPEEWGNIYPPLGVELKFWAPGKAEYEFLTAFYRYGGRA